MPVPLTCCDQSPSPSSIMNAPYRSTSYLKQASNTSYYSPTVIGNAQPKLNVVTRVAIEGKAKKGEDGASVRMYLKLAIPIDSVNPGTTVALFSEENVKIHSSQVHPLDSNSIPYNFSSGVSPLLKNAARALKLPARSPDTFSSVFNLSQTDASTSSSRSYDPQLDDTIPPVDVQYTGQIIVSGYNISYVLPKVFLTRKRDSMTSMDEEDNSLARTPARRRLSIGDRNHAQFMAAIDMWIPFVSRPPRSPYMLSIPTPRCLHNHIKLRIFPPNNTATSFASLSSIEEDNTIWDLTSDPAVTRTTSSHASRQSSLSQHFADDESSDSSNINIIEGCEMQGTFPSAERVRVRWAKPLKTLNIPGNNNGRRRVGVEEVKADMVCTVHGKGASLTNPSVEGVLMDVEYKAHCKGVWFPGVATQLALDVGLEAKGSDITWPAGYGAQWEVTGGAGFTGFDNGIETNRVGLGSRSSSTDSTLPADNEACGIPGSGSRVNSSSLLRAPLPAQNMPDYSFEGQGPSSSSTSTLPSVSSLPTSSTPFLNPSAPVCPPGSPVSLYLNMNELQPSSNNSFTFKIFGTVLVTARTSLARVKGLDSSSSSNIDKTSDPEPIVLPRLTVLAADVETTAISIRNAVDSAVIEVYHPTGDIHSDPQTRKTVLQKGGFTRCGEDGGRMALKFLDAFNMTINGVPGQAQQPFRPRTSSNGIVHRYSSNSIPRNISARHRWEGPVIIPSVAVTVTALAPDADMFPTGYAVRVCLQTPTSNNNEFLQFGIAHSSQEASRTSTKPQHKVHIICATIDGVAVKSEVTKASRIQAGKNASGFPLEDLSVTEWICWAKVFCGNTPGCPMIIDYLVQHHEHKYRGERGQIIDALDIDLLLPIFFVSVARYEVTIDVMPSLEIAGLRSNFDYHHAYPTGSRLLRYSLEEYSQSQLVLTMRKPEIKSSSFAWIWKILIVVTWVALLATSFRHNSWVPLRVSEGVNHPSSVLDDVAEFVKVPAHTMFESIVVAQAPLFTTTTSKISEQTALTSATIVQQEASVYTESLSAVPLPTDESTMEHHCETSETTQIIVEAPQSEFIHHYGLIPVDKLFIFDWSAKQTFGRVIAAVEALWNICRTLYHYPLPPP